jgi:ATP-binding cassette subfamily F protein 3
MSFALKLVNVKKTFVTRTVFEQVNAGILHGEKVALVGSNGVGKTTLLGVLTGALEPDEGAVLWDRSIDRARVGLLTQQAVFADGETIWEFVRRARVGLLSLEAQLREIEVLLAGPDISREIDPWMQTYGTLQQQYEELGGYAYDHEVERVLREVGLPEEVWQTEVSLASGGQKTRAQLARLSLLDPQLLLLDEPTNHLDAETMDWLEGVIRRFPGTVVTVSHDRWFLDRIATRVLELRPDGLNSYPGNYTAYVAAKEQERQTQQMLYRKQQAEIKALEEAIQRFRKWYHLAHDAAGQSDSARAAAKVHIRRMWNKQKQLDRIEENRVAHPQEAAGLQIKFEENGRLGHRVFRLEDVAVRFGERTLYEGVTLDVERGQRLALIGPNGIGKSTLLKVITGELEPTAGVVKRSPSVRVGYFGQEVDKLDPERTILEEVLEVEGLSATEARTVLAGFLFRGEAVFRKIGTLSQGERCRVAFVKLYFSNANVLVLDEPTNYLDIAARERIEAALLNYPGTLLLVSHDRYMVQKLATSLLLFEPGRVTAYPDTMEAYAQHRVKRSRSPEEVQREEQRMLLQMELSRLVERLCDVRVQEAEQALIRAQMDRVQEALRATN